MLRVGLTGGIGSGKTTVSDLFSKLSNSDNSLAVIDTDIIAREIVQKNTPVYTAIVNAFGQSILNEDLSINRKALRQIIFSDADSKILLESITHPAIQSEVEKKIQSINVQYCIIVIPLLFETKSDYKLDRVLVIDTKYSNQIKRVTKRDNSTAEDIEKIIHSQISKEHRLQCADDIIVNNGEKSELTTQVEKLHKLYLNLNNA